MIMMMLRQLRLPAYHNLLRTGARAYGSPAVKEVVKVVEVGPRDGLQNEKGAVVPVDTKVELIERLVRAGVDNVEAGSFVSPKWVPQMGGTQEVLKKIRRVPGVHYAVLVPNKRGLDDLLRLLDEHPGEEAMTDEVSVFTAATDAFNKANVNMPVKEHLMKLEEVVETARGRGLRVRGYVSVVVQCPYSGKVDPTKVREVSRALRGMGCYEVSLGDTVGMARPWEVREVVEEVKKDVEVSKLAGHFHDTYGTAIANVLAALESGVRTIDASVGGLGGCPYSPGATGNVATEDVLYALQGSGYRVQGRDGREIGLDEVVEIGVWINGMLGRETGSRVGKAGEAKRRREERKRKEGLGAKL
ncbi:hypothetical protein NMY22_g19566 [Coprinellus aureogranulatus]|nr:hypothetical protein NMY22_g19566 [Coprinellus aureogranulatus]